MRRESFAFLLLTLVLSSAVAQAAGSTTASCRKYIALRAQRLSAQTIYHQVKCHRMRMLGDVSAAVNCNDLADAGFPSSSLNTLNKSATTFLANVAAKCAGLTPAAIGYAACPNPCTTQVPAIASSQDVAQCAVCLAEALSSVAVATAYGTTPPITATKNTAWSCQNRDVGSGTYAYTWTRMKQQRVCQYKEDTATIGAMDCKTADLTGAIAKAVTALDRKIGKCLTADLATLSSCGTSVAAEQGCILSAANAAADALFDFVYPTVPPTATPTATSTPTVTPTRTSTGTPTATTSGGSCPSANFLNVTGAAGAGAGYPTPSLSVSCSGSTATVHSNGIPTYQYVAITPNGLQAKNYTFTFPSNPVAAASTTNVPLLGNMGVSVNGVPIYAVNEGPQPASDAYGDPIAAAILDECGSHSAQQGTFHYHKLPVKCLIQSAVASSQPWNDADPSPTDPSPIVGYAFDGFPIYGPYECTDVGCASVQEMLSSWDATGYQAGTIGCMSSSACSNGYCNDVMINGMQATACVPKTCVWSNNAYTAKAGSQYLDKCNGHVGPNGDYHYHTTSTFPYILGCYRGTPTNNGGNGTPPGGTCP